MGLSKQAFMETREGQQDIAEYFQWLKEEEWQHYVSQMEDEYHKKYGYALMFRMKWAEFKTKNGIV